MPLHFPSRELEPYAQPIEASQLRVGEIYFSVQFLDDHRTIPVVETLIFIGRDLSPEDTGVMYFQDAESHRNGIQFPDCNVYALKEMTYIFEYERALERLMLCSLRRSGVAGA